MSKVKATVSAKRLEEIEGIQNRLLTLAKEYKDETKQPGLPVTPRSCSPSNSQEGHKTTSSTPKLTSQFDVDGRKLCAASQDLKLSSDSTV